MAVARRETFLPIVADPSHSIGIASLVPQMALAAVAAGADGLVIEVHPRPDQALSDGPQSLTPAAFRDLMQRIRTVAEAVGVEA
jgi:3-deoxy-D-arabino-heptulosonate 7-phosphate (DAHP) synthase